MRRSRRVDQGFTLQELFVVIAIVAVLAALLLPALSVAKAHAHSTACKNNLRQIGTALKMYVDEHQSRYPYYLGPSGPAYGDATGCAGQAAGLVYWSSKLFPYYPVNWTNAGYHCPGYKGITTGPYYEADRLGSYAYNVHGAGFNWTTEPGDTVLKRFGLGPLLSWPDASAVSEVQVRVPSEMLAVGDSQFLNSGANGAPGGTDVLYCSLTHAFDPARHGKKYNQLWCDGHISEVSPHVLFNRTNAGLMWNYDHQPHPELWQRNTASALLGGDSESR